MEPLVLGMSTRPWWWFCGCAPNSFWMPSNVIRFQTFLIVFLFDSNNLPAMKMEFAQKLPCSIQLIATLGIPKRYWDTSSVRTWCRFRTQDSEIPQAMQTAAAPQLTESWKKVAFAPINQRGSSSVLHCSFIYFSKFLPATQHIGLIEVSPNLFNMFFS